MTTGTLFGPVLNMHDIAISLLKEGFDTPYIAARRNFENPDVVSIDFYQKGEHITLGNVRGIYVIFRRLDNVLECLYVGYTMNNTRQRVYRYFKELEGKSRCDEGHAGAFIAKTRYGVKSADNHYIKVIPWIDIYKTYRKHGCFIPDESDHLDEHIAYLLKSKCNITKRTNETAAPCQEVVIPDDMV